MKGRSVLGALLVMALGVLLAFVVPHRQSGQTSPARTVPTRPAPSTERGSGAPPDLAVRARTAATPALHVREDGVVTDPRARGYDAGVLLDIGLTADRIFAAEPRDVAWAPILEQRIAGQLQSDLAVMVPAASVSEVSCHTAVCRVDFSAPLADADRAVRAVQMVPFADRATFEMERAQGSLRGSMFLFYGESHDPTVQAGHYAEERRTRLRELVPGEGRLEGITRVPHE
jgi:hypothetical protein